MLKRVSLILLFVGFLWGQVSVTASVDVNRISQSETVGFKIVATNADGTPNVDISPLLKDFKIVSGPAQQTNIQWVNGAMTSSRSLSWTLLAKKEGKLNVSCVIDLLSSVVLDSYCVRERVVQKWPSGGRNSTDRPHQLLRCDRGGRNDQGGYPCGVSLCKRWKRRK